MADPNALYVVMTVVVAGLVLWVVAVNLWAPKRPPVPARPAIAPPEDDSDPSRA